MRIIAGSHRGRRLAVPPGQAVRPTVARAREALFNILAHGAVAADGTDAIRGARVLDAFAGTGALGLEALSRGADAATFMERDRTALACLRRNLAALGEGARARVLAADASRPPAALMPCDLVFLDPPYGSGRAEPALAALAAAGWLARDALCVIEIAATARSVTPAAFMPVDDRRYGRTRFRILRYRVVQRNP